MVTLLEAIVTHHDLRLWACWAVVGYLPVVGEALVGVGLGEAPRPDLEYLRQKAMYLDKMIPIGRCRDVVHRVDAYRSNASVLLPTQAEWLSCKLLPLLPLGLHVQCATISEVAWMTRFSAGSSMF
jgi:hypothetical protein